VRVGGTSTQRIEVEGPTICRALVRLTGEKLGEKPAAWIEWWERAGPGFAGEKKAPATGD
jgi:hypothetical protein